MNHVLYWFLQLVMVHWSEKMDKICYLRIEDHVNTLVDDVFGVVAQKLQYVLHLKYTAL